MMGDSNMNKFLLGTLFISIFFSKTIFGEMVIVEFDKDSSTNTTNVGVFSETGDTINSATYPGSLSYTISGLTVDSIGIADDSISFSFGFTATGSDASGTTPVGFGFNNGAIGVNSAGTVDSEEPSLIDAAGESLSIALTSSSISLGVGATETGVISFVGFTGANISSLGSNDRFDLSGGTGADGLALASDPSFDPVSSFTIGFNTGGVRVEDIQAQFKVSVVPEPTSALLFGLFLAGSIPIRRRPVRNKCPKISI